MKNVKVMLATIDDVKNFVGSVMKARNLRIPLQC